MVRARLNTCQDCSHWRASDARPYGRCVLKSVILHLVRDIDLACSDFVDEEDIQKRIESKAF